MYKGTTPSITLTLPDTVDLGSASSVYVTFANKRGAKIMQKTGDDLQIDENVVVVYLTQEETLSLPTGRTLIQVNWTYIEDGKTKRACTEIAEAVFKANLEAVVLS